MVGAVTDVTVRMASALMRVPRALLTLTEMIVPSSAVLVLAVV